MHLWFYLEASIQDAGKRKKSNYKFKNVNIIIGFLLPFLQKSKHPDQRSQMETGLRVEKTLKKLARIQ